MKTGIELKLERIKKKIRAKDVALTLGVTTAYVSILENEKQTIPTHIYRKWIKALNLGM